MEKGVCDLHSGTAEGAAFAGLLDTAGETARARAPAARRRLWDLRPDYHCSICGTCLSLADFRKVAGKAGLRLNRAATDHEVHGWFVKLASEPGRVAKSMHKLLDRKHRNAIERCRKMRGEANLRAFWEESLAKGDVSGPYWAIMTHPLASEALLVDAFGDVHMLSHLLGASNRADIRRLRVLETERGALSGELAGVRRQLSMKDADVRRLSDELGSSARAARRVEKRLADAQLRLSALTEGGACRELSARVDVLESRLEEEIRAARAERRRRIELEREASELRTERDGMHALVAELGAECEALEHMLEFAGRAADDSAAEPAPRLDLGGRRIAYLGGRAGLIGHFRALVRRSNGELIHHDGGVDDSAGRLGRILGQADAVLCPVDCVSHGACLRAKRFCKRAAKPFVPLRSAGLSSFVGGLRLVAEHGRDGGGRGSWLPVEPVPPGARGSMPRAVSERRGRS